MQLNNNQIKNFFVILVKNFSSIKAHTPICLIGGGSATMSFVGQYLRSKGTSPTELRIFDPAQYKYFEPAYTLTAGGIIKPTPPRKEISWIYNKNIPIVKEAVVKVIPEKNQIITSSNTIYSYDQLLIHTGQQPYYDSIKGAKEALDDPEFPAGSIYEYKYAVKLLKIAKQFKGGNAVFTEPIVPIKCRGSSQKILFLYDELWRKSNVRDSTKIFFYTYANTLFDAEKYANILKKKHELIGTNYLQRHVLKEINKNERIAIFEDVINKKMVSQPFDFLHIIPQHLPQKFIKESNLSDEKGYVQVDKHTLQHVKYKNIWSSGDAAGLPTSKTFAGITYQAPVLLQNILLEMRKEFHKEKRNYYGNIICPILIGDKKILLAESKYGGQPDNTFFKNQEKPRHLPYYMKKYLFSYIHWYIIPHGYWGGTKGVLFRQNIY